MRAVSGERVLEGAALGERLAFGAEAMHAAGLGSGEAVALLCATTSPSSG